MSSLPRPAALLAPGASSSSARLPGRDEPLPAVDQRLVAPEQPVEMLGGERVETMGSNQPHGTAHFDLAALLRSHLARGFLGAVDMLMRPDRHSDFAPDASVFPEAPDPKTGGRQLEELVFEVIDTQPLAQVTDKARRLSGRGVREVFCLDLPGRRVLQWVTERDGWVERGSEETIVDPRCLVHPLPVRALLDAAEVDEASSAGLLAKGTRTLTLALDEQRRQGKEEGRLDELRRSIADLAEAHGLSLTASEQAELARLDLLGLEVLRAHLKRHRVWPS